MHDNYPVGTILSSSSLQPLVWECHTPSRILEKVAWKCSAFSNGRQLLRTPVLVGQGVPLPHMVWHHFRISFANFLEIKWFLADIMKAISSLLHSLPFSFYAADQWWLVMLVSANNISDRGTERQIGWAQKKRKNETREKEGGRWSGGEVEERLAGFKGSGQARKDKNL